MKVKTPGVELAWLLCGPAETDWKYLNNYSSLHRTFICRRETEVERNFLTGQNALQRNNKSTRSKTLGWRVVSSHKYRIFDRGERILGARVFAVSWRVTFGLGVRPVSIRSTLEDPPRRLNLALIGAAPSNICTNQART